MRIALFLLLASFVGGCCVTQPASQPLEARIIGKWKAQDGSSLTITAINPTAKAGSYVERDAKCKYTIVSSNASVIHLQLTEGGLGMILDKMTRDICFDGAGRMRVAIRGNLRLFAEHVIYTRQR